ncbi:MAG TPA: nicotinamide riboside transporter PnuC [Arachidicoccus soli]|nr:nicotinamide riboside transporter PnuC [Arachidicoccus soli]
MDIFTWVEIASVTTGLLYVVFMMRQNIWCWICGILSSGLYIFSCFHAKIYLEAGLNFYYVVVGFYGWQLWLRRNKNTDDKPLQVTEWRASAHIFNILICILLTLFLGKIMQLHTDSPRPYFDAALTVFGFSATILEARKILSAWIYWFIINGAAIILMIDREMPLYAGLSLVMTLLCIKGYLDWKKSKMQVERTLA